MKLRTGMVGLGLMGHGMAKNLVVKGYPLAIRVHRNRQAAEDILAAGAREVKTNADLARNADMLFVCVTGTPQVEEIVYGPDGVMSAAREGLVVVDCSTAEPASTNRIRADLAAKGVTFVDAPLARTPKEAEEGRLNTMVGADDATFARVKEVMSAFCENVIHVGPPGAGHVIKLLNNFIAMSAAATIAEACAAAAKAGVPIAKLHAVISAGGVNSGIFQMTCGRMLEGDLAGLKFAIGNAQKDLRYYTHLTESLGLPSFMGEAAHQSFVNASALGFGDRYIASLFEAQEKLNGIRIVPRG